MEDMAGKCRLCFYRKYRKWRKFRSSSITAVGYAYDLGNTALRIRQGASTSSAILGNIYEGDSVNIIGEEGNWYKILYNNSTAYVSKDYITLNESAVSRFR